MKKLIAIMWLVGGLAITLQAQSSFSIQYSMAFGGEMNSFISSTSLRGVSMEYKIFADPQVSIGFDGGWNVFYERRAYDTYTSGTLSLSGIQYRYAHAIPLFVTTNYYFKPGAKVNPFAGIGIGTIYFDRELDMGIWAVTEDAWHFALKPEAGVLVSANPDMDIIFGLKYNYGFETSDANDQSYLTFNVGFVWK